MTEQFITTPFFDVRTGMFIWAVKTATISAILFLLWFSHRDKTHLLYFTISFALSAIGSVLVGLRGIIPNFLSAQIGSSAAILALTVLTAATLKAEKRPIEGWIAIPFLVWLGALCIPIINYDQLYRTFAYGIASFLSYCTVAIALLTTKAHISKTRKVLASILVIYSFGFSLALLLNYTGSGSAYLEMPLRSFTTIASSIGFIAIMLTTAKMLLDDNERKLQILAQTDYLTNTLNRRGLEQEFISMKSKSQSDKKHLVLIMFDIDHFKKINDKYGHQIGDLALIEFSKTASSIGNHGGRLVRMGGEEFALLLKINNLSDATAIAEHIRMHFAASTLKLDGNDLDLTVSIGLAGQTVKEADLNKLMLMADRALYSAKKSGRNRTVVHDDDVNVVIPAKDRSIEKNDDYTDRQVALLNRISSIAKNAPLPA